MTSLALSYAVGLLARREYSEFELRNKMQQKAFSPSEIAEVLNYCQQKNWQSDKRYCENYLRYRSQRGYGINRIKQELRQLKGIPSTVISEVLMESEIDWESLAHSVLAKKFPDYAQKQPPKITYKIYHYMLARGFLAEEFKHFIGRGEQ